MDRVVVDRLVGRSAGVEEMETLGVRAWWWGARVALRALGAFGVSEGACERRRGVRLRWSVARVRTANRERVASRRRFGVRVRATSWIGEGRHEDPKLEKGMGFEKAACHDWSFFLRLDYNSGLLVEGIYCCSRFLFPYDYGSLGLEMCPCLSLYELEAYRGSDCDCHHMRAGLSLRIGHGIVIFLSVASLHPHTLLKQAVSLGECIAVEDLLLMEMHVEIRRYRILCHHYDEAFCDFESEAHSLDTTCLTRITGSTSSTHQVSTFVCNNLYIHGTYCLIIAQFRNTATSHGHVRIGCLLTRHFHIGPYDSQLRP
jgi:hypothetical protein